MIKANDILLHIGECILESSDLRGLMDANGLSPRVVIGRRAGEGMNVEDHKLVISVAIGDGGYDLGYVAERTLPIDVIVTAWSREGDDDGVIERHNAPAMVLDAMHYIAEAMRGSDVGADVIQASGTLDVESWPVVVGTISAAVSWPVALNSEASYAVH